MSSPPSDDLAALQRVAALIEIQRWADAAAAARSLLTHEPENWRALCLLSQSLSAQGDFSGGLEAARAALARYPDSDWPHRLASIAERSMSRPTAALTHANEAVRLAPQLAECHRVLAQALMAGGDLDGAARAALAGLELAPDDAANHRMIGAVAFQRGELEAAEAAYARALALAPDDAVSHNELARIALRRSQQMPRGLARSAEGFARALAADPRQSGSRNNLELVLAIFLARGAYFLFLAAWLTAVVESHSPTAGRILGVAALVVPLGFAARFLHQLSPRLRRVLLATIRADRRLAGAVASELLTVAALVAGALAGLPALSIAAVLTAILARLLVYGGTGASRKRRA